MLSGIRKGKAKKKKPKTQNNGSGIVNDNRSSDRQQHESQGDSGPVSITNKRGDISKNEDNLSVAERLKQALASGVPFQSSHNASSASTASAVPKSYMERVVGDRATRSTAVDTADGILVLDAPGTSAPFSSSKYISKYELRGANTILWAGVDVSSHIVLVLFYSALAI